MAVRLLHKKYERLTKEILLSVDEHPTKELQSRDLQRVKPVTPPLYTGVRASTSVHVQKSDTG